MLPVKDMDRARRFYEQSVGLVPLGGKPDGTTDCTEAIAKAIATFPQDLRVVIYGTGGMSHQLQGERAGLINRQFDTDFLDNLTKDPVSLTRISHTEYMREAGSEGVEMVMWHVMRGALGENASEVYRHYHVPASNTAAALMILDNRSIA